MIDARPATRHQKQARQEQAAGQGEAPGVADARRLIAEMGWAVSPSTTAVQTLAEVLDALSAMDSDINWQSLLPYAQLTDRISELDIQLMNGLSGLLEPAERAVLVCVLLEPALLALRRLAQEDKSARLFSGSRDEGGENRLESGRSHRSSAAASAPDENAAS
ncbi:hypothetical protein [Streptomyces curacoi]|uniref:Uncharacterized protein n=1 Tax=Streptomyces curacoi TaxID=146536 RepID=A0A124H4N3_9ACTN|nr:hypothetical protein [Streptomyces curacoi]KUM78470.1 hypothetical protein AQI70_13490 [Streptomyces curacoi]